MKGWISVEYAVSEGCDVSEGYAWLIGWFLNVMEELWKRCFSECYAYKCAEWEMWFKCWMLNLSLNVFDVLNLCSIMFGLCLIMLDLWDLLRISLDFITKYVHLLCFDMNVARHLPTFLGGTNNKAHTGRSR